MSDPKYAELHSFWRAVGELLPGDQQDAPTVLPSWMRDALEGAYLDRLRVRHDHGELSLWQCPNCVALNPANEMVCDGEEYTCPGCGTVVIARLEVKAPSLRALPEDEALWFLGLVETEEITIRAQDDPRKLYSGVIQYQASNGWKLAVFKDAGEWDYVDRVCDGAREWRWWEACDSLDETPLQSYRPPADVIERVYRFGRAGQGARR